MKKPASELKSKEVFTTTAKVLMLRGVRYAWCKLALIPGKLFILVPVDAECEMKG